MIERIERISIIAHKSLQERLIETLTRLGTVHIERICGDEYLDCKELSEEEADEVRRYSFELSKVEFLLGLLQKYREDKPGFISTLIRPKYPMTFDEFLNSMDRVDIESVYDACFNMEKRLDLLTERRERLEQEHFELKYWGELEIAMEELKGDPVISLMMLRIAAEELEEALEELDALAPQSSLEIVSADEAWAACILLYHPTVEEGVSEVLSRHTHERVTFRDLTEEPLERLEQVEREIAALDRRREALISKVESYEGIVPDLEVIREFLANRRMQCETVTSFGATDYTIVIDGWVIESGLDRTAEALRELSDELTWETRRPTEEENPPVSLRNRKWIEPFEMLTKLYGTPNKREYDPTWLVAISFVIFFGFCIGDVGYGLVIIVAFLLMRRFLPLGENTKNLMLVMVYGGFFAIIFGVLTGSWFGYDPANLPHFMSSMQVFDALADPIPVMLLCMVIGLVHMLAGTFVEMRNNLRQGNIADVFIGQGLVVLLILGTSIAAGLYAVGVLPKSAIYIVAGSAIGGMIILGGYKNKSIPGKMFGGIYETYNTVVGWLGDTVSYLRLFALGLATFAIGWVVNTLAGMANGIAPFIGLLFMVLIIVVGHTFNVTINLLGAFVHPLRLEYVEFFGKFYEGDGRGFKPLKVESKTVLIKDEAVGK